MWYKFSTEEILKKLNTNKKIGLAEEDVKARQQEFGKNIIKENKKESIIIKFIKQFNDFMIIILIIASIISAIVSKIQGENDYFDSIIIIAIVVLNALMGLIQEERAEKSIESLKNLTPKITKVLREGQIYEINVEELVPGDIIELENGKYVPADCRIIESSNLRIEESSLTGETDSILKQTEKLYENNISLGDIKNMAYMSTIITSGHGEAVVTEIGMDTKIGKIANMITKDKTPETPIQRKLTEVGKILGLVCLSICAIIFIIGLLKRIDPIQMFMTSVGLAVAAIPEGLPAIVTIMLSIGVTKMAKNKSIIRRLSAVETLGSSNVICSDKTGTLTQNKMTVVNTESSDEKFLLELGCMCTDCIIQENNGKKTILGEATEIAIVDKALEKKIDKIELYKKMPRIDDIPFDSNTKMMTTVHIIKQDNYFQDLNENSEGQIMIKEINNQNNEIYRYITKGAPDILVEKCTYIYINGSIKPFTSIQKNNIKKQNLEMANKALRVLAVAYKDFTKKNRPQTKRTVPERKGQSPDENLIFVGLIGMIDPPREGVKEAVYTCKKAGIKTVMITGDHIATAKAIAKELGILSNDNEAITGAELDKISDKTLEENIEKYSVFARVTPEHKVRIVKAWQKSDAVVAMTGDGVNDSPALKNADIGIAMGKCGTDVAKNAADMILLDDNFVTIVKAVKQGRNIYDNIRKAIHFLISTNIGEIVTMFIGLLLGLDSPLLAIQLLWINFVTDSFPAIALGLEKEEENIMNRPPREAKESIFANGLWNKIVTEGVMIGSLTLLAFSIGNKFYSVEVGRTMAFLSLGLLELVHSFNIKSEESIFTCGLLENKFLVGSFFVGAFMQIIVAVVPYFANIFELVPLNNMQWIYTFIISLMPIPIMELQKFFNSIKKDHYSVALFKE